MWIVTPARNANHSSNVYVIPNDFIMRAAHSIPVYGITKVPFDMAHFHSLDAYRTFYVNKFADHHMFEILG